MFSILKNQRTYVYLLPVFLLALALKYVLAHAPLAALDFLLWIPAQLVSLCYGVSYRWDPTQGYVFPSLGMYINQGCAAINFLVILFLSLSSLVTIYTSDKYRLKLLFLVSVVSYPLCLMVNSFRILVSVQMQAFTPQLSLSLRESLHEFVGGLCFFSALVLIVLLAEKIIAQSQLQKTTPSISTL